MLHLYNTLNRGKEAFEPLDESHVRMYVCGPTVYDFAHIGNARPVVVFDVLYRMLKLQYPRVTYVRNITDVDDKINAKARETGETIRTITDRTAAQYHTDMAALGTLNPDIEPRATEHIAEMVVMTETLIDKGFAYEADGHVLFSVASWDGYGKLSKHNRDEIIAGARVEVAPYKKDAADFVLWKPSSDAEPGWDSPWGFGRPGWHLECSAMSEKYLGAEFDIHGGGQDLIFPHHENEIAQSRCAHGTDHMARYWMHNGYLMVEGEKMSKSLGNFYTVHDLLEEFPGEAIRLALLKAHYRQPLDFTKAGIREAKAELDKLYGALRGTSFDDLQSRTDLDDSNDVRQALEDDLNTPLALAHLHERAAAVNKESNARAQLAFKRNLRQSAAPLGILQQDPEMWFQGGGDGEGLDAAAIDDLIEQRKQARADKDFALSDKIRDDLAAEGVVLEDGPEGTIWKRA